MTILAYLAGIVGVVIGLANVPQIIKIFRTKSSGDLSAFTIWILCIGTFIWLLYGLEMKNIPVMIMNGLAFLQFIILISAYYKYNN